MTGLRHHIAIVLRLLVAVAMLFPQLMSAAAGIETDCCQQSGMIAHTDRTTCDDDACDTACDVTGCEDDCDASHDAGAGTVPTSHDGCAGACACCHAGAFAVERPLMTVPSIHATAFHLPVDAPMIESLPGSIEHPPC